jgi:hypothetical protein
MNMAQIVKWVFIVIMMAPLPVLVLSSSLTFILEKVKDFKTNKFRVNN